MIRQIGDHVVYEDARRVGYPVDLELLAKEANYRVARLGELLGLSPRTLQRYFIAGLGVKPKYWLREQRMRNLYQLLSEGRGLDEAAAKVGLQRYDYLAREVRFFEGITPEELFLEADDSTRAEAPDPAERSRSVAPQPSVPVSQSSSTSRSVA